MSKIKLVKFIEFLKEKSSYLFENPYYNRTDLLLKSIIQTLYSSLTKDERKKVRVAYKYILEDLKVVSNKRREKKDMSKVRIMKLKEDLEIYEALTEVKMEDMEREKELNSDQSIQEKKKESKKPSTQKKQKKNN